MAFFNYISRRGDTFSIEMDLSLDVDGQPQTIDITGWIFTLTLKEDFDDATPAAQTIHTVTPAENITKQFILTLTSEQMQSVEAGKYFWDIEQRQPATPPNVDTVLTVAPDIDKARTDKFIIVDDATRIHE